MSASPAAADVAYEAIEEGTTVERDYDLTPDVMRHFLEAFDDRSPMHVDAAYARAAGFPAPVAHGAILNGFVSHFVGMVLPGRRSLLLTVDLRFDTPSYPGDRLRLAATVSQKVDAQRVVVLTLRFRNVTRGTTAATGRAQVRVRAS
jgi:acyl dehydratase